MKKLLACFICVLCIFSTVGCVEKKETYSTDYTDLSITGLQEVYYTAANEEFSVPQPVVRNGKGEKCELAVVCSIADNSNKAVPKENGKIKNYRIRIANHDLFKLVLENEKKISISNQA